MAAGAYEYLCMRHCEKTGDTVGDISRLFVYYVGRLVDAAEVRTMEALMPQMGLAQMLLLAPCLAQACARAPCFGFCRRSMSESENSYTPALAHGSGMKSTSRSRTPA